MTKRLAAFAAAGVTDMSVRVLPIGAGRDELLESSRRTRELVARSPLTQSPDRHAVGPADARLMLASEGDDVIRTILAP